MKQLKDLKLNALKNMLTKEQMKKITGGYNCRGLYEGCSPFNPQLGTCCTGYVCVPDGVGGYFCD